MATNTFTTEAVMALAGRLHDHAEELSAYPEHERVVADLKQARVICHSYTGLRTAIGELIELIDRNPHWGISVAGRDLRETLETDPDELPQPSRSSHHSS